MRKGDLVLITKEFGKYWHEKLGIDISGKIGFYLVPVRRGFSLIYVDPLGDIVVDNIWIEVLNEL